MSGGHFSEGVRQAARERAASRCEYCRKLDADYLALNFEYDHALPKVAGGDNSLNNCVFSCSHCNSFKGIRIHARDPESNENVLLFNPRQMAWKDHFTWSNDKLEIMPLTATGRATVVALKLNREPMRQHRRSEQIIEKTLKALQEKSSAGEQ